MRQTNRQGMGTPRGRARLGRRTKELVRSLHRGEIAFIDHEDLDELAARTLLERGVRAVVNARAFLSGRYPARGAAVLSAAGIALVESCGPELFLRVRDGDLVEIRGEEVWSACRCVARGRRLSAEEVQRRIERARARLTETLGAFLENTLERARGELAAVLAPLPLPPLRTRLRGRPAVVVVRGPGYKDDLHMLAAYVRQEDPVLVAVDGGADALREFGHRPHLIVGDMDSVSDASLRAGAEVVVHAYLDGRAPGLERLRRLGVDAHVLPAPGTSEDLALLLAYEAGAEPIVVVGSHTSFVDFLDKGRQGMASTLLVHMKVGHVLIEARGVSRLYRAPHGSGYLAPVLASALLSAAAVAWLGPAWRNLLHIWLIQMRLSLGF